MKKFPDNIKHPKYHSGIIISCPDCKAQIRIELTKPLKGDKIKKLVKSVERVYTMEEVQKEFDEKKKKEK